MADGGAVGHLPRSALVAGSTAALGRNSQETIMYGYSGMMGGFGVFGGGLIWLLVLIVLALSIAALIKYLRS